MHQKNGRLMTPFPATMSSILSRLNHYAWVHNIRRRSRLMFSKYLLFTNTAITVGLSGTGDAIQQKYERYSGRQKHWDMRRTINVSSAWLMIGPVGHYWYIFLDTILPGRTAKVVLKKLVADQLIMSPLCVFSFLLAVSISEGATKQEVKEELVGKGPALMKAEWVIWPPAQLINFYFLPTRFRILYDNVISLGFDCYYSYIKFYDKTESQEDLGNFTDDLDGDSQDMVAPKRSTAVIKDLEGTRCHWSNVNKTIKSTKLSHDHLLTELSHDHDNNVNKTIT